MSTKIDSNKPLIIFFILAFAIAWGLMGLVIVDHHGLMQISLPLEAVLIIGSWVPNIAAFLVLAFVMKRKGGIRNLLSGWLKFRVRAVWYLVALSPILIGFATIASFKMIYGYSPSTDFYADPAMLVATLVLITVTGAMGEELGWRGFALPWLLSRMGALSASLLLGILWSLWHLPLWFAGLGFENNPYWAYAITGISFTVILTWACNNSRGSMVIASLFHFALNVSVNMFEGEALHLHAILFTTFALIVVFTAGPKYLSAGKSLPIDKKTKTWIT